MGPAKRKKFNIVVDGKNFNIEVLSAQDGELTMLVNGRQHTVTVDEVRQYASENHLPDSRINAEPPATPPADSPPTAAITAPMPGDIVEVSVQPGDRVAPGQTVCTLEAMKMKNMLRVSRAGVVTEVLVSPGQRVDYGDVLVKVAGTQ